MASSTPGSRPLPVPDRVDSGMAAADSSRPLALAIQTQPGDEWLGAPVMLQALAEAGWQVCCLVLDRNGQSRTVLAGVALGQGWAVIEPQEEVAVYPQPDEEQIVEVVGRALGSLQPALVLSPSPQETRAPYRALGQATRRAIEAHADQHGQAPVWWMWTTAVLPASTVLQAYDRRQTKQLNDRHRQHPGLALLERARLTARLSAGHDAELVETVLEAQLFSDRRWRSGPRRQLDAQDPLPLASEYAPDLRAWMDLSPLEPVDAQV